MLNDKKLAELKQFIAGLSGNELSWTSGYLAGLSGDTTAVAQISDATYVDKATIIYATDTGNTKKISSDLSAHLKKLGIKIKLKAIETYQAADLAKEKFVIFLTSTHGEGDPPEVAESFYETVMEQELKLDKLNVAVLGLGDTNYKFYNQTAKDFHKRFTELGAKELVELSIYDLDYEDYLDEWFAKVTNALTLSGAKQTIAAAPAKKKKSNKYQGEIINNILLNDVGSNKKTYHVEIAAEDLEYQPGDALGIKIGNNSPRLYSIASSLEQTEDEVHLTVAKVEYKNEQGEQVTGLCSGYLAEVKVGDKIDFYISKNNKFRLPDANKDIIMVGPGTGIAPFRAFMAERDAQAAVGKNWLFFGDQHARTDFLYQAEWQEYIASGLLTKIDLAFSRDQEEKIYVQHRIKENAAEVKSWLENGAYFYVCGDKEHMAKDVENTLIEILGEEQLKALEEEGRYLKDVY